MAEAAPLGGRALRLVLLALLALQIAGGLWKTVREAHQLAATRWDRRHETTAEARAVLGPAYVVGLEAVEAAIPPDGTYLLVDDADERGWAILLQGDLAPRRALLLDPDVRLERRWQPGRLMRDVPARAVIFHGADRAPEVVRTRALLTRTAAMRAPP